MVVTQGFLYTYMLEASISSAPPCPAGAAHLAQTTRALRIRAASDLLGRHSQVPGLHLQPLSSCNHHCSSILHLLQPKSARMAQIVQQQVTSGQLIVSHCLLFYQGEQLKLVTLLPRVTMVFSQSPEVAMPGALQAWHDATCIPCRNKRRWLFVLPSCTCCQPLMG